MSFDTKTLDLAGGPLDLTADPDVCGGDRSGAPWRGRSHLSFKMCRRAPRSTTRNKHPRRPGCNRGHCMLPGDGFALRLAPGAPAGAWVWAASTGLIAVSPAG